MGRHVTSAVTLLVLCGILVAAAVWGWQALFSTTEQQGPVTAPSPTCSTEDAEARQRLRSRQVTVSVYNAGSRSGLASETLRALERRGFQPGEVGNAPASLDVRKVQIRSVVENDPAARLVARQFGKRVEVVFSDDDFGRGIDVIVGDRFDKLAKAKRSIKIEAPSNPCVEPANGS